MSLDQFLLAHLPARAREPGHRRRGQFKRSAADGPNGCRDRVARKCPSASGALSLSPGAYEPVPAMWPRGHVRCTDRREWCRGRRRAAGSVPARGAAGIAGPAAFTGAWIASSLRQTRQGPGGLQLSGLAAPDARDPWIMLAGFLVLGCCTFAFGAALREALRGNATGGAGRACPRPGRRPATVAAGLLRRDHLLVNAPGGPGACGIATRMTRSAAWSMSDLVARAARAGTAVPP